MMSIKLPIIFLLAAITGGCQALTVNDLEKKIKPAGQPGQSIVIQYSTTIVVKINYCFQYLPHQIKS